MNTINTVLGFVGYLIMIPVWILAIVLMILGIIGLFKKNFTTFKKVLKIWGYFWIGFAVLLVVKFISTFIANT